MFIKDRRAIRELREKLARVIYEVGLKEEDYAVSATLGAVVDILPLIAETHKWGRKIERVLDLGCGFGGLTLVIAKLLGASEVWGVDIDDDRLKTAEARGLKVVKLDLEKDHFPFPNDYFDFIISFGVVEHLTWFDNVISESYRVLARGGGFLLSIPNLASYINRIALLLGYQPRDVEISQRKAFGVLRGYDTQPIGHIHAATLRAVKELLEAYGFQVITSRGIRPPVKCSAYALDPIKCAIIHFLDKIFFMPSLSRRFAILARKF